jgi:hypothetical protein
MNKKPCGCIEIVDKMLEERGVTLHTTIPIARGVFPRVMISVTKLSRVKRAKTAGVVATYCPFCGRAYNDALCKEFAKQIWKGKRGERNHELAYRRRRP